MSGWQRMSTAPIGVEILVAINVHNTRGGRWWERHVVVIDTETQQITDGTYAGWDRDDYDFWHDLPELPHAPTTPSTEGQGA